MTGVVDIIRRVVRSELARRRSSTLAVITAIHAHTAEDDDNNYEVDVRLKHEDLELRRVPVAVPHAGVAAPPVVGDLVLVQPLDGDLNQPLVTGRFYHAGDRPPLYQEGEVLFEHRVPDGTLNHLRFAADGTIVLQRDVKTPEDNSDAKATIRVDGNSGEVTITCKDIPVTITCSKLTVKGDVEVDEGDLKVTSSAGKSTTISGNEIKGA